MGGSTACLMKRYDMIPRAAMSRILLHKHIRLPGRKPLQMKDTVEDFRMLMAVLHVIHTALVQNHLDDLDIPSQGQYAPLAETLLLH